MTRCVFCGNIVWPWDRKGFAVLTPSKTVTWHPRCPRDCICGWRYLSANDGLHRASCPSVR